MNTLDFPSESESLRSLKPGEIITGFVLALFFTVVPVLRWLLRPLFILIHECGHTVCRLAFGYPALPSFSFTYGSGMTLSTGRMIPLVWVVYVLAVSLLFQHRHQKGRCLLGVLGLGIYSLLCHTGMHTWFILFMGHGMEVVVGGVFIYRALSHTAIYYKVERPLYIFLGFALLLQNLIFSWHLLTSTDYRFFYIKGWGGHANDFVRISDAFRMLEISHLAWILACTVGVSLAVSGWCYKNFRQALDEDDD